MKWNDAEVYFASETTSSERRHWEMQKDESGKYALIREEKLVGVFDNTASAIEEGHRLALADEQPEDFLRAFVNDLDPR